MKKKIRCSNCGKFIGKIGVLSPNSNAKKRNMCLECVKKVVLKEEK